MSSPAQKFRVSNISAVIWRNPSDNGPWYSVQISRSYKNGDDEWRNTDSLGQDDIQNARKALDLAHDWIIVQLAADRKARKDQDAV